VHPGKFGNHAFWQNKQVFITGVTGFKGAWLYMLLKQLGAKINACALAPTESPNLFQSLDIPNTIIDIRDSATLSDYVQACQPEIVFHLAAQSLVRPSYESPLETFSTNMMGTANVLEASKQTQSIKAVISVATDKCYENKEWHWGYRESDSLGGHDPYSASKAGAEIIANSYRRSFYSHQGKGLATARAGNVIGGGDWARDRLIPDIIRSIQQEQPFKLRFPDATRPWQHVLDCLWGYLVLAEATYIDPTTYGTSFNFGPPSGQTLSVKALVNGFIERLIRKPTIECQASNPLHESKMLALDTAKANQMLRWHSVIDMARCLDWTAQWYNTFLQNGANACQGLIEQQIKAFLLLTQ